MSVAEGVAKARFGSRTYFGPHARVAYNAVFRYLAVSSSSVTSTVCRIESQLMKGKFAVPSDVGEHASVLVV